MDTQKIQLKKQHLLQENEFKYEQLFDCENRKFYYSDIYFYIGQLSLTNLIKTILRSFKFLKIMQKSEILNT